MSKKKTSAYRAYQMLQTLPVGSTFLMGDIMKKMPEYVSPGAVGNMFWHMRKGGYLEKLPKTQQWVILDNTKDWHEVHKFNETAVPRVGAKKRTYTKRAIGKPVTTSGDIDIIEDLLTAMARAEPVLRKYKQLDEIVNKFANS